MRLIRILRAAGALLGLALIIVGLHWAARFELGGPSGVARADVEAWLDDPVIVIATFARWLAVVLAYYLAAVVIAVGFFGEESPASSRFVPRSLVGPIGALIGVGAIILPTVGQMEVAQSASAPLELKPMSPPLLLVERPGSNPTWATPDKGVSDSAITESPPRADRDELGEEASDLTPTLAVPDQNETLVAELGDSFWALACDVLIDAWGRSDLGEDEIAAYWRELIDANRDRLVEPGNPDLILPGQEFVVPAPPADPRRAG